MGNTQLRRSEINIFGCILWLHAESRLVSFYAGLSEHAPVGKSAAHMLSSTSVHQAGQQAGMQPGAYQMPCVPCICMPPDAQSTAAKDYHESHNQTACKHHDQSA